MCRIIFSLIIVFICSNIILAQNIEHIVPLKPTGFTNPLFNGYGNSGLQNSVSNISSINPAALDEFNKTEFGISYQFGSNLISNWPSEIGSERISGIIPQSIGLVFPVDNFRFGISFNQDYNLLIKATPSTNSFGTVLKNIDSEIKSSNYSLSASYKLPLKLNNVNFIIGFRYSLNSLSLIKILYNTTINIDESFGANAFMIGAVSRIKNRNSNLLRVGLYYHSEKEFVTSKKFSSHNLPAALRNDRNPKVIIYTRFPSKINFDFELYIGTNISLLGSISKIFWENISSKSMFVLNSRHGYYKNQYKFSASIIYKPTNVISPSLGVVSSNIKSQTEFWGINDNLNVVFILTGFVINYNNLNINLVLADSHLFSGDWGKQTIFKSSVSYGF